MSRPRISVVIPAWNRAGTIEECLLSVISQSLPPDEVIVVDDGSTDDTAMLAAKVGGVRVLRHDWSLGAQAARNTGVRHASHDWIAFQDSDDTWEPEKLARQVAQLDALPDSAEWVLHCDGFRSDRNTGINDRIPIPRFSGHCYEKLLRQPGPMFQGLLVHRSKLDEIGMLDESCPAYQEWDTAIRLARVARFIHVNEPLFHWHWHDGETISKDNSRDFLGFQYVIEKHRAEIERVHGAIGWRRIQAQNLARGLRLGCFARILVLQSTTPKLAYAIAKGLSRLEVCPRRIGGIMQVAALLPV